MEGKSSETGRGIASMQLIFAWPILTSSTGPDLAMVEHACNDAEDILAPLVLMTSWTGMPK